MLSFREVLITKEEIRWLSIQKDRPKRLGTFLIGS